MNTTRCFPTVHLSLLSQLLSPPPPPPKHTHTHTHNLLHAKKLIGLVQQQACKNILLQKYWVIPVASPQIVEKDMLFYIKVGYLAPRTKQKINCFFQTPKDSDSSKSTVQVIFLVLRLPPCTSNPQQISSTTRIMPEMLNCSFCCT